MFTHVQSVAIKQLVCGKCRRETIGFEGGIDDMSVNRNLETISSMVADPMIAIVSRFFVMWALFRSGNHCPPSSLQVDSSMHSSWITATNECKCSLNPVRQHVPTFWTSGNKWRKSLKTKNNEADVHMYLCSILNEEHAFLDDETIYGMESAAYTVSE